MKNGPELKLARPAQQVKPEQAVRKSAVQFSTGDSVAGAGRKSVVLRLAEKAAAGAEEEQGCPRTEDRIDDFRELAKQSRVEYGVSQLALLESAAESHLDA